MIIYKRERIQTFKLLIFFLYNIAYALYMSGYLNRSVNLILLFVFIVICLIEYLEKKNFRIGGEQDIFFIDFKRAMVIVFVFFGISITIQIIHSDFNIYLINQILYNLIPPLLAFLWINTVPKKDRYKYFILIFIRALLYFFLRNGKAFSFNNIAKINWNDSKSSIFETSLAHDFLFLEIIFLYFEKKYIAIVCAFLCMLSFKRISFIMAVFILVYYFITKNIRRNKKIFEKRISNRIIIITILIISLMPFVLKWITSDSGISFFNSKGINLNKFTTGRVGIIRYVTKSIKYFNGYGSSDYFLKNHKLPVYRMLGSMHCDLIKLYYEVTEIGVIIFTYELFKISQKKLITFIMMIYMFLEIIASHFIDQLNVWNLFFMFVACLSDLPTNKKSEEK